MQKILDNFKMSATSAFKKYLAIKRIKKVHDAAKAAFEQNDLVAHGWDHIYRDTINAIWIGRFPNKNRKGNRRPPRRDSNSPGFFPGVVDRVGRV